MELKGSRSITSVDDRLMSIICLLQWYHVARHGLLYLPRVRWLIIQEMSVLSDGSAGLKLVIVRKELVSSQSILDTSA